MAGVRTETPIRAAAERAAAEVRDLVYAAALDAARAAVRDAIRIEVGVDVVDVDLEDRVTRTEAARRLGTTSQTIIRLEQKGAVRSEKEDGRVYVRLSDVRDALQGGSRVMARARIRRNA